MLHDGLHGLDLTYNRLNLIQNEKQDGATIANYSNLADGTKLAATDGAGNGLLYRGSLVYKREEARLSLESAGVAAGRIIATATSRGVEYLPQYFITDHLGSVRVIIDANGNVSERNDFYPFGMRWNRGPLSGNNRYRHNGKEEQKFLNLPFTEYGARQFDTQTGKRFVIDPLAEKYYPIGTYVFCAGNPVKFIDPDGRGFYVATKSGEMVNIPGNTDLSRVGYHYLSDDDAKVHEIKENHARFQAAQQAKTQLMMAIFSPDNVGTVLALAGGGGEVASRASRGMKPASNLNVWKMSPLDRGWAIERRLGGWGNNFPVIDKFENGIATSIKSLDLGAKTYQKTGAVFNKLKGYIDDLAGFSGGSQSDKINISLRMVKGKTLELALPSGSGFTQQ